MNKTITIEIPQQFEDMVTHLESLHYEVESRKELIAFALEKNIKHTPSFDEYQREYKEICAEYDLAKKQLEKNFIIGACTDYTGWRLDFEGRTLYIDCPGQLNNITI